jgi:putative oxidoreductase
MKNSTAIQCISALLIMLFVYTAYTKLLNFGQFKLQMSKQAFPLVMAKLLVWILPIMELLTALLLFLERTRLIGFYISFILLTLFTGYILLILLHTFNQVPCPCGGVLQNMGWPIHLVFNLFFLLFNILAIVLSNRERRRSGI